MGISTAIGLGLSAAGLLSQKKAAKKQAKLQKQALNQAAGAVLSPFAVSGPAGTTSYGANGTINTRLSPDMQNQWQQLSGLGTGQLDAAGQGGLPQSLLSALQGTRSAAGLPGDVNEATLALLQGGAKSAFSGAQDALGQIQSQGFQRPLQNTAFLGAGNKLLEASQGYGQVEADTLANLRALAAPEEERAFQGLQQNLFSTGRLGSTGGALQTEAFARGLGEADLSRQLAAKNQALQTQQTNFGIGQGLAGIGTQLAGTENDLLSSAFANFANTANLGAGLGQQRFANSMLLNNTGYDRANTALGNEVNMASLPTALQGSKLALALQALQGQAGLQQMNLNQYTTGLATAQSKSNSQLGAASTMGNITTNPNFTSGGDFWSQILTGAGSRMMGGNSIGDVLGGIFGKIGSKGTAVPQSIALQNMGIGTYA